ncbi:hypothetical protein R1T43_10190 [Alteromonas sp. CI.11.F.A3]|uniref:hypothetical protein n=1 Tax=unclassified Alteromonas TaxID=2614992 RepID=UPI001B3A6453|nr:MULTISPECIES: hypothetical protein [unclassified Alteromonas]MBQ4830080.1 hypothetical protein [Alteromonas sp. MMG017]WOI35605.1 hypothetical protein R1T43_10190 [Alteromonas sp. CI.11.F.A3]
MAASAICYIGSSLVQIPYELKNMFVGLLDAKGVDIVQSDMQSYLTTLNSKASTR